MTAALFAASFFCLFSSSNSREIELSFADQDRGQQTSSE